MIRKQRAPVVGDAVPYECGEEGKFIADWPRSIEISQPAAKEPWRGSLGGPTQHDRLRDSTKKSLGSKIQPYGTSRLRLCHMLAVRSLFADQVSAFTDPVARLPNPATT